MLTCTKTIPIPSISGGVVSNGTASRPGASFPSIHRRPAARRIRAVTSKGDRNASDTAAPPRVSSPTAGLPPPGAATIDARVVITIKNKIKEKLGEKAEGQWEYFLNGMGLGILVQLVSNEIDPETKSGKRSKEVAVRGWLPRPANHPSLVQYAVDLKVPSDFGSPGAVVVTNPHSKEFYLLEVVVRGFSHGPVVFPANSWIHSRSDNPESRILFGNHAYLPSQTPYGLRDLREKALLDFRGNGEGQRKTFDRTYDYAVYNDLGNPDKDDDLSRPVLGGKELPYPRRCRTGRPPSKSDPSTESRVEKPHPVYVPRDETFEEVKQASFSAGTLRALFHNLIPALRAALSSSDNQFTCFSSIDDLYKDGLVLKNADKKPSRKSVISGILNSMMSMSEQIIKYEIPSIISRDRFSWLRDNEFARQALAGVNPVDIERLREFPIRSKLDPSVYGPPESAITKEKIENELHGMSLEEAMEKNRLYMIDYHDILLPFLDKINSLEGRRAYASRTIFFCNADGLMRPILIELSLPSVDPDSLRKWVYAHGHDATTNWIWRLAKAHVCSIDAGVHQLVNHWLRTHACMEPYIIAAHRQLSFMHPVYKLLHPHMRYTMEINALARQSLINAGGIIENCFTPGKYSMELSAAAYSTWRFDMEALPADLLRRGMAIEDSTAPGGVRLVVEDYPYAADGLLVWSAIEDLVRHYVAHFYSGPTSITSDVELQSWWSEIKNKGHEDKRDESWWPDLRTQEDLVRVLTTMIWVPSGQHAALNFGQYPFGGYMPNRPTLMKKLIPQGFEPEYQDLMTDPQLMFLSSLPSQLQATQVMAVQDTLSTHSPDEEYLGQLVGGSHTHWVDDPKVLSFYKEFSTKLEEIEGVIERRNRDLSLKNRCGAGIPPYELLIRSSEPGVTGRGIPNSISI